MSLIISQQQKCCVEVPSSCIICPLLLLGWQGNLHRIWMFKNVGNSLMHTSTAARSAATALVDVLFHDGTCIPSADAGLKWQHLCQGT